MAGRRRQIITIGTKPYVIATIHGLIEIARAENRKLELRLPAGLSAIPDPERAVNESEFLKPTENGPVPRHAAYRVIDGELKPQQTVRLKQAG